MTLTIQLEAGENFGGARNSGIRHTLVFDPETVSVGKETYVGHGGQLMSTYHGRAIEFAIPFDAVASEVVDTLRAHEDEFEELAGLYQGAEWDGNNMIGQWADRDREAELTQTIEQALAAVPCYWDAGEYLDPVVGEIRKRLQGGESVEALAADYAETNDPSVYVCETDLAKAIERIRDNMGDAE